jgi:hypothetical protein
MDDKESPRRTV